MRIDLPRVRRIAATLGCGMKPLRGKEGGEMDEGPGLPLAIGAMAVFAITFISLVAALLALVATQASPPRLRLAKSLAAASLIGAAGSLTLAWFVADISWLLVIGALPMLFACLAFGASWYMRKAT